jgi:hypothetical protein
MYLDPMLKIVHSDRTPRRTNTHARVQISFSVERGTLEFFSPARPSRWVKTTPQNPEVPVVNRTGERSPTQFFFPHYEMIACDVNVIFWTLFVFLIARSQRMEVEVEGHAVAWRLPHLFGTRF